MREIISFEGKAFMRGIGQLRPLLFALRHRRIVEFDHESFETVKKKHLRVRPRNLKEYDGRWYLCADIPKIPKLLIIGIDRIENLFVTDIVFSERGPSAERLEHAIGVSGLDEEPRDVVLEFTPLQGQYLKTLPMHASQTILEDSPERLIIGLHVVANFELRQRILGYGSSVRVLEPLYLAKEVKDELEKTMKLYRQRHVLS